MLFRIIIVFLCLGGATLSGTSSLLAQEPGAEEFENVEGQEGEALETAAPAGDSFFRFSILTEMMAMRFNTPHPFKQMTGSSSFDNPAAFPGFGLIGPSVTGQKNYNQVQSILRKLPAFSIEYLMPFDFLFIGGTSFEYYHTATLHMDAIVAFNDKSSKSRIPKITMVTFYDLFSASVHAFNPAEEGVNIFFGIGAGGIDGAYEGGFRGRLENNFTRSLKSVNFGGSTYTFRKVGLDAKGDTFGIKFALYTFSNVAPIKRNVFVGNPLTPEAEKEIYFDGTLIRAALTFRF